MATPATTTPTNAMTGIANALNPATGKMTGQQETLSTWAGPYVTQMLGKAQALGSQPYQVYGGPLTAGESSLQNKFFTGLGGLGFPGRLGQSFTGMTDQMDASGQPVSVAQQYMNPYMQQVLQPQLQAMQRQADIQRGVLGAQQAKAGAFGGARAGLMNAQLNADLMRQQQQAVGNAYGQAYTQGLGQFNTEQEQARQLAGMLGSAGAAQRGIEQEGVAADLAEFQQQRDYPYKMLQFQQSLLQGLPIQSVAASYQQPSAASRFANTTGGLMSLFQDMFGG